MSLLLGGVGLLWSARTHAGIGERFAFFGLSPEVNIPIGGRLRVMGVETCDSTMRYCLEFPIISFGLDVTRPSSPGAKSISLAFLQAPLTGVAALATLPTRSPGLKATMLALTWLAGGTFRWAPGGEANVGTHAAGSTTLSFVVKNEVALHPFVRPIYLRVTPGAGVALTRLGHDRSGVLEVWTCAAGGFASLAAEYAGQRQWDPGVWLTCLIAGDV